jgi:hypothetical protein
MDARNILIDFCLVGLEVGRRGVLLLLLTPLGFGGL